VKPVRSPEGDEMIGTLAATRGLLVFDFDGTLAPIIEERALASMRPTTAGLVRLAALLYPCAVISGRDRSDVGRRVASAPLVEVIGNHGAESGTTSVDPRIRVRVTSWVAALEALLPQVPGLEIERKACSVAIHHRSAALSRFAVGKLEALVAKLPGSRVFGGDAVINVVPREAASKGDAIADLASRQGTRTVMFVGDDVTDEDAFRSPVVTYPVRVGRSRQSAATWFIEDQAHVDVLLRTLVQARQALRGAGLLRTPRSRRTGEDT
jgi:trehalose 6-phosphate phosphatase